MPSSAASAAGPAARSSSRRRWLSLAAASRTFLPPATAWWASRFPDPWARRGLARTQLPCTPAPAEPRQAAQAFAPVPAGCSLRQRRGRGRRPGASLYALGLQGGSELAPRLLPQRRPSPVAFRPREARNSLEGRTSAQAPRVAQGHCQSPASRFGLPLSPFGNLLRAREPRRPRDLGGMSPGALLLRAGLRASPREMASRERTQDRKVHLGLAGTE